jgi:YndJ-like protein
VTLDAIVHPAVALGMLVVVPLGLALIDGPGLAGTRRWWPAVAVPGAASLYLPRGWLVTVLFAGAYAAGALVLAGHAAARLYRRRSLAPAEVAVLTALVCPLVAAGSLVAERSGYRLAGFRPDTLTLTVAHFHYAGFAAALVAGLVSRAVPGRPAGLLAALSVPAGTALVFAGYLLDSDGVQAAGAAVLTAGMWAVGWLTWREVRPAASDRLARTLLGVSAVVVVGTMLLALDWAVGEALGPAVGVPHLPLRWMAATHGLANALGFALCGLVGWYRLRGRGLHDT